MLTSSLGLLRNCFGNFRSAAPLSHEMKIICTLWYNKRTPHNKMHRLGLLSWIIFNFSQHWLTGSTVPWHSASLVVAFCKSNSRLSWYHWWGDHVWTVFIWKATMTSSEACRLVDRTVKNITAIHVIRGLSDSICQNLDTRLVHKR